MMRKLSVGVLVAVLLFVSAACTGSSAPAASTDPSSPAVTLADATPRYREGVYGVTID